mmetsp:Transcript_19511/g.31669  ORF Transcript_19511/g.31669 Transcript_19511/m.31669 type:complete len:150 (+) Transcript_19511:50-499(+)
MSRAKEGERLRDGMKQSASRSRAQPRSPALSRAGSSSICGSDLQSSIVSSAAGSRMRKTRSDPVFEGIPEHLANIARFPVADKDIITGRVEKHPTGKVPRIIMHPRRVKAMWWPGLQAYTAYDAEFVFDDPPEWHPDDILKEKKKSSRR